MKALDKIERIELPKKRKLVKFDFRSPARSGEQVATIADAILRVAATSVMMLFSSY